MARNQANSSYPAGEATPIEITDSTPIPVLLVRKYLGNSRTCTNQYNHSETPSIYIPSHAPPHPHLRPSSSWYSQPSIAQSPPSHTRPFQSPSPPPPVPRLTSTALRSLEQRFAVPEERPETGYHDHRCGSDPWQHSDDEDDNDNDPLNPSSTPTRRVSVDAYLSAAKRTAVSEYLRDRTWLPSSPSHSPPLPVGLAITTGHNNLRPGNARRRSTRDSITELANRAARNVSMSSSNGSHSPSGRWKNDSRKSVLTARPDRRGSGVPARPFLMGVDPEEFGSGCEYGSGYGHEYEHGCEDGAVSPRTETKWSTKTNATEEVQRQILSARFRKPSLTVVRSSFSVFGSRKSSSKQSAPSVREKDVNPLIGIPYEKSRVGPAPIQISTIQDLKTHSNSVRTAHQQPRLTPQLHSQPPPSYHPRPCQITTPSTLTPTTPIPTPSNNRNIFSNLPTRLRPSASLQTRTRDPMTCSNQGVYLYIGTLRGPTPSGLRSLHNTMERAIARYGEVEGIRKGCKEIRKWLRYEERGVIEWVFAYVRGSWGVEV